VGARRAQGRLSNGVKKRKRVRARKKGGREKKMEREREKKGKEKRKKEEEKYEEKINRLIVFYKLLFINYIDQIIILLLK
jgi:hypothetical protein